MAINKKNSAPIFATTDLVTKRRIDRLTKLDRRYTMSYVVDACVRAHLPKIEEQLKAEQQGAA